MKMIKSIKIELETSTLNLKIEDALVLRDELNKLFPVNVASPQLYNVPLGMNSTTTIPCVDQYSVYSTKTTAHPDETWNPAG